MDPATHALSGALLNRVAAPRELAPPRFTLAERTGLGAVAALWPDIDWFLGLLIEDPLVYLNLHRGETHSLILLPLWALLLGWLSARLWWRGPRDWRDGALIFALGIGIHIVGDWITNFGTQLFAPFSRETFSFPSTFIVDPWITGFLILGLLMCCFRGGRLWAGVGLGGATAIVVLQGSLMLHAQEYARAEAEQRGLYGARVHAMAQPLSPFHWRLFIEGDAYQLSAHLGLFSSRSEVDPDAGIWQRHWQMFQPPDDLVWEAFPRFGEGPSQAWGHKAWHRPEMAEFRQFAELPYLRKWVRHEGDPCAVFADLRFRIAQVPPPFQYAICRSDTGEWRREAVDYWDILIEEIDPPLLRGPSARDRGAWPTAPGQPG